MIIRGWVFLDGLSFTGKNFPTNLYSTIAGFIEAGESAEACLKREVKEEVGIEVHNIKYFQSQSWPFPGQLRGARRSSSS